MTIKSFSKSLALGFVGFGAGIVAIGGLAAAAERTVLAPPPSIDAKAQGRAATAVLAGGCFWGLEAVFSHVKGVTSVTSGYAGGTRGTASYDQVSTERTGHAEAIRITYDPRVISYGTLLRVYVSVAHDPTQLNRQGPDSGVSYRSAIFPQTPEQARVARAYYAQLGKTKLWGKPLVTRLETGQFFPAESYHQNFAVNNPNHPYIRMWDAPKTAALKTTFPALWKAQPAA